MQPLFSTIFYIFCLPVQEYMCFVFLIINRYAGEEQNHKNDMNIFMT